MAQSLFQYNFQQKHLIKLCCHKMRNISPHTVRKHRFSSVSCSEEKKNIKKSVFISQSNDIFSNLALEDWFYRKYDFTKHHALLMWCNSPCVVIGRHQNPWLEANIFNASKFGVKLARRNSGGGTVYHDEGNLNLTFFTPRKYYNRRNNLELISQALFKVYGISSTINSRDDIVIEQDFKISGTAAKLGQPNAYHHCTLLIDANKTVLSKVLHTDLSISTKATQSTRSHVMNLCELNSQVTVKQLSTAIGHEYLYSLMNSASSNYNDAKSSNHLYFKYISPEDKYFPGVGSIREEFSSWQWRFGRTPKFIVTKSFSVPERLVDSGKSPEPLNLIFHIENGIIQDIIINGPLSILLNGSKLSFNNYVKDNLQGQRFTHDTVKMFDNILQNHDTLDYGKQFIINCIKKIMLHA